MYLSEKIKTKKKHMIMYLDNILMYNYQSDY